MNIQPKIIEQDGKKAFVQLSYEDYQSLIALIQDYEDLKDLREAKAQSQHEKAIPLRDIMSEFVTHH